MKGLKKNPRDIKNFYDSHRIETVSGNYSNSVCKVSSKLKKEISFLKSRFKKAEKIIENVCINGHVIYTNNKRYAAGVRGLHKTFKEQYIKL